MSDRSTTPAVSVIIATFNEPGHIVRKSVQSILEQSYRDLEVLIFDDSKSQETRDALDECATDPRVRIIRSETRMGFVPSLNMGLHQARGRYIARMDGDDISLPDRISKQVAFLDAHPTISVVGGSMMIINEADEVVSYRKYPTGAKAFNWLSVFRTPLAHPTVMLRKECVLKGYFYDESFKKSEDLEYWLRLRKNGFKLANMADYLLKYRVCGDLSKKREDNHWGYNLKARRKNFSWKLPLINGLSLLVSFTYNILPNFVMSYIYKRENNRQVAQVKKTR
jgi:glycosyltransferase involved in cell wall biosynthesis